MKELKDKLQEIERIIDAPLEDLNNQIEQIETAAKKDMKTIEVFVKKYPDVNVEIKDEYTIARYIKKAIGLYVSPTYQSKFEVYTSRFSGKHILFYAIKNNVRGYYSLCNAVIKEKHIQIKVYDGASFYCSFDDIIIKKFQNGRIDLKKDDDLLECIRIAKKIDKWING